MTDSLKTVRPRNASTPQTEKAAKGQKKNAAGGYTFTISDMDRAKRFLVLGSETNYYVEGAKLSKDNAKVLIRLAEDPAHATELVDLIVEISTAGRAPKANPALFALAVASSYGTEASRGYALSKLSEVARTGTHLFLFAGYVQQFRGWGRALRRAVANWYTEKSVPSAAYSAVKYQSREGFSNRDLFRLSHPVSTDPAFHGLGEWILRGNPDEAPPIVQGFVMAQTASLDALPAVIKTYGLTWEMIPTEMLNEPKVWDALLDGNVPLGALIRQLPRLTRIGVVGRMGKGHTAEIVKRLTDPVELEKARIHPMSILLALKTYSFGASLKGSSTWIPVREIIDALDSAFYLAFKAITPAGKRTLIGLDVSGSMQSNVAGMPISAREATAAIALVTVATEPFTHVIGFTGGSGGGWSGFGGSYNRSAPAAGPGKFASSVTELSISPKQRLDDVVKTISGLPFGTTDCSLPMQYALEQGLLVDTFIVMTDNETYAGSIHPHEALKRYRAKTGIDAKLVVLATTSSYNTIANPSDSGMIDLVGLDSATPGVISSFSRGDI